MCIFPAFRDFYGLWLNMAYGERPKAVSQHWFIDWDKLVNALFTEGVFEKVFDFQRVAILG